MIIFLCSCKSSKIGDLFKTDEKPQREAIKTTRKPFFEEVKIKRYLKGENLPKWKTMKSKDMENDLYEINNYLQNHGGSWEIWYNKLESIRQILLFQIEKSETLISEDKNQYFENLNWLFFKLESENDYSWPRNTVKSLIKANQYLLSRNIDFIVVPVPPKEYFTVRYFTRGGTTVDNHVKIVQPYRYKLFKKLIENEIEVIDLLPAIYKSAINDNRPFYYPTSDQHPMDSLIRIAALKISNRLKRRFKMEPQKGLKLESIPTQTKIPEEFVNRPYKKRYSKDYIIHGRQILNVTKELEKAHRSQILIIGDSFAISTENRGIKSADIWAKIAHRIRIIPMVVAKPANAPNVNIEIRRINPEILKGIKVCILFFDEKYLFFKDEQWK